METNATASWEDLKLNPSLQRAVKELGFAHPTEIQLRVIPPALSGQAVIGIAQTGTGKTAAYLLPILRKTNYAQGTAPRALILAPTKELVVQIATHARQLAQFTDLRIVELYGGVGPKTQIERMTAGCDVIVSTPGRFMELYLRGEIEVKQLSILVLDEADRMMDMGFMPQLRRIQEVIPSKRQNLLFSATFPVRVEQMANEFLLFPVRVEVTPPATRAQLVAHEIVHVPNLKSKINLVAWWLTKHTEFTRVIIFTRTKASADSVANYIERSGLGPVRVIHSNKGQNSRINAIEEFRLGNVRVLVSTDVSSRGIDVPGVTHVINFDMPADYEDYVHRIGRTGRAFTPGRAITLVTPPDEFHIPRIESLIKEKIPVTPFPSEVNVEEFLPDEEKEMARESDRQRRLADPTFKGAFHERKKKKRG